MEFREMEIGGQIHKVRFEIVDGRLWIHCRGLTWEATTDTRSKKQTRGAHGPAKGSNVRAPMPGKLIKICVQPGQEIEAQQVVAIMEAMKMEYTLKSSVAGRVKSVPKAEGIQVALDEILIEIDPKDGAKI
jgi:biotin carboxyl carrier protein